MGYNIPSSKPSLRERPSASFRQRRRRSSNLHRIDALVDALRALEDSSPPNDQEQSSPADAIASLPPDLLSVYMSVGIFDVDERSMRRNESTASDGVAAAEAQSDANDAPAEDASRTTDRPRSDAHVESDGTGAPHEAEAESTARPRTVVVLTKTHDGPSSFPVEPRRSFEDE